MNDRIDVVQYEAFVGGDSFVPVSQVTILELTGADRLAVLNNLCTADLRKLETDQGTEAFITDLRGRTIGHVCIYNCGVGDRLLLIGLGSQSEILAAHIDRYVIREDVEVADRGGDNSALLFSGRTKPLNLPGIALSSAPQLACGQIAVGQLATTWVQLPWTSDRDVLVIGDDSVAAWAASLAMRDVGEDVLRTARIEAGMPEFGIDFNDENLPQEIDRNERAISFTKGCYLGQETIARLDALGQIQKKLVRLSLSGQEIPPVPTKLLSDGKAAGEIRSACWSPASDGILALGFVRRKWFESGSQLEIDGTDEFATVL